MILVNGIFGVGALLGPIFVYIFETNALSISGLLIMAIIPFYFKIVSPEINGFAH